MGKQLIQHRLTTRERILEASLKLFNVNGYAATSLSDIAQDVGIAKGNLTYHFATKKELALEHKQRALAHALERRNSGSQGSSFVDSYVETIWYGLSDWWSFRFLYRDHAQYQDTTSSQEPMTADIKKLHASLQKMQKASMIRTEYTPDLEALARTLFMVTRFWFDHLRETEDHIEFSAEDQRRGLQHHFAVLLPNLTAAGRRKFQAALDRLVSGEISVSQ